MSAVMFISARDLMGYDKPINLHNETSSGNAYDVEDLLNNAGRKGDFYVLEVSDTISYLPSVGDAALPLELECTEKIGDLQKSASPDLPVRTFDTYSLEFLPSMIAYLAKRLLLLVSLAHAVYFAIFLIGATAIYTYHLVLRTMRFFTRVARLLEAAPILLQLLASLPKTRSDDQKILLEQIKTLHSGMKAQDSKIESLQNAFAAQQNVNVWKKNIEAQNSTIQVQGTKIEGLLKAVTAQRDALATILAMVLEAQLQAKTSPASPPVSTAPASTPAASTAAASSTANFKFSPPLQIFGGFFAGGGNNAGTGLEFRNV